MASRIENGSMVYTTNTMKRKNDTCGERDTLMTHLQSKVKKRARKMDAQEKKT